MAIERRGNGWRVRWRALTGRQRSYATRTKSAADWIARQIQDAKDRGIDWQPQSARRPESTLGDAVDEFLRELGRHRAAETVVSYRTTLRRWLLRVVPPDSPVTAMDYTALARLYDESTGAASSKSLRAVHAFRFWLWLYEHDEHGALLVERRHRPRRLHTPVPPSSPVRAPTWAQMDWVLAHASGGVWRVLLIQRFTGLRVSQARALRWDDIDLNEGEVLIRGELGKSQQERMGRRMPVSHHLIDELSRWNSSTDTIADSGLYQSKCYRRAWADSGLSEQLYQRRPTHAFRKGFVSGLRASGADREAVEFLVGHSLGLRGVYLDPASLPLRETIDLVPAVGTQRAHLVDRKRPVLTDSDLG